MNTADMSYKKDAEKFEYHKSQMVKIFGCVSKTDQVCRNIQSAENIEALNRAVEEKKVSEQKSISDRINLLECCLGIDKKQTCEGISENNKDLKDCKTAISKKSS